MEIVTVIIFIAIMVYSVWFIAKGHNKERDAEPGDMLNFEFLITISFVRKLSYLERERFAGAVAEFLKGVRITPVKTEVSGADKLYIGASAVIPMFYFPGWVYLNLNEIFVYGDNFNIEFETDTDDRNLAGLVGTGVYSNKMFLSKPALQAGFGPYANTSNTAIHEFVHLIDGADGETDGVPHILLPDKTQVAPWVNLMQEEMQKIADDNSDINPYALTKPSEFFAVASEYFFMQPELFEQHHPELFQRMQQIFSIPADQNRNIFLS